MFISLKNTASLGMNPCSLIDVFRRLRRNLYQTTRRRSQVSSYWRTWEFQISHTHLFGTFSPTVEHVGVARCSLLPYPAASMFRSCFILSLLPQGTCFSTASWTCVGGIFMVQFLFRCTWTHFSWQKFLFTVELHLSGLIRTASHPDMQ